MGGNEVMLDQGRPPVGGVIHFQFKPKGPLVCTASIAEEEIGETVLTGGDLCLTPTAFSPRSLIEATHQKSGAFIHPFFELLVLVQQQRQKVGDITAKVNYSNRA